MWIGVVVVFITRTHAPARTSRVTPARVGGRHAQARHALRAQAHARVCCLFLARREWRSVFAELSQSFGGPFFKQRIWHVAAIWALL